MTNTQPFFERIRIPGRPLAHPDSIIVQGSARFTLLTSRLIRMEWAADGQFEDRGTFAFPNRFADVPAFSLEQNGSSIEIKTDFLTLHYHDNSRPFDSTNLSVHLSLNGQTVQWTPGASSSGNLRGTRRTLDGCADAAHIDDGLLSRDGWSVFDDSGSTVWDREQIWVEARSDAHQQDWYFFGYGHSYKALLHDYMQFGGAIPLVPRYVLGTWWSRFWAYSADDLKALVGEFQSRDIPLDVLVIDMDWHTTDGWTGYSWNRQLFPDPTAFLAWVHSQNLYATLNLHPADGVQKHEDVYPQFARAVGRDPSNGDGIPFRCADKAFMEQYFALLHHPLEEQGVDFWWLDWQQGTASDLKNLDPLPWLNHLHFRDAARRGRRPMLYSRWGGLGNHRYPIGFSGDTYATWQALRFQPYFTATAANVAYGWWSHDIGGHFKADEPEIYARWVQFGAVSPCLRLHSSKDPLAERRPWAFPTPVYEAAKAAFQFRYQLLPYLYSATRTASQQGLSLSTPMYYDYPDSDDAYLARDQYFLGDQLIAAPIVTPSDPQTGLASVDVWLPEGTWVEYTTLETFVGPRWVRLWGDLNRIPLFARAGAIVPQARGLKSTDEFDGTHLMVMLFPGADGRFDLYEDDGTTDAYQRGEYATTPLTLKQTGQTITFSIGAAQGNYPGLPARRTFELRLRGVNPPQKVMLNHADHTDWRYEDGTRDLIIFVRDAAPTAPQEVTVQTVVAQVAVTQPDAAPWVHLIDYPVIDDAQHQLGTLVFVPPADGSPFDAEIEWSLLKDGTVTTRSASLKACTERQIVHCPFGDAGDFRGFRWRTSVNLTWRGQTLPYRYESPTAYPAVTRWQSVIDSREKLLAEVWSPDSGLNPALTWDEAQQTVSDSLSQPYALILQKQVRHRDITSIEPMAAWSAATINSPTDQTAVLYVQHVGEATPTLNGAALQPIDPVQHEAFFPVLAWWMSPQEHFYALPLQAGDNQLLIASRPDAATGWCALGALVLDASGRVMV